MKKQPSNSLQDHYTNGYNAFFRAEQNKKGHWFAVVNKLKPNTTPAREWQRGYDKAYLSNLEKLNGNGAKT
jgi:hypothetical protein